jgi:hypothetical protein
MFLKFLKNFKFQKSAASQSGVTLLLAILVLSALVAISFSFASIILVEIRASGDVQRTEPAYYAVQGVVEEVIFKIKRGILPTPANSSNPYNFDFGACSSDTSVTAGANVATQNSVVLKSGICNRNPQNDVKVIIPPNSDVQTTKNIYTLYDPSNPYTNTYSGFPSAYSKIEFDYLSGSASTIYFCPADKDCSDGSWTTFTINSTTSCIQYYDPSKVSPVAGCASSPSNIQADKSYQFFVVNSSTTNVSAIRIKSWGPDPQTNPGTPTTVVGKGLPSFGQSAVDVTASSLGLTRKYQVIIPNQ